jgi:hypothetical protein
MPVPLLAAVAMRSLAIALFYFIRNGATAAADRRSVEPFVDLGAHVFGQREPNLGER